MSKKIACFLLLTAIVGACGHFAPEVFSRDFVRHEADHQAALTVVTNAEGIGNFVFVDAPGGRFQIWDEDMSGNIGYIGVSGAWPAGRPALLEANAADRSVYIGTSVSASAFSQQLRIDRMGFSAIGRPTEAWQNVCLGLPSVASFEVHGSTLYTLIDAGSHFVLEWRDSRNCMLRGSRIVNLPAGRRRASDGAPAVLAYDNQTRVLVVGIELAGSSGRRDVSVTRFWTNNDGSIASSDETFARTVPANAGLVDLDAEQSFLLVTSFEPGYDPSSANYDLDLYYNNASNWRLEDSLSTLEVSSRESVVAAGARTFSGAPCASGKKGMYFWIARGPYQRNEWKTWDHNLLERRAICAD